MILVVLFWIAVIAAAVWLVLRLIRHGRRASRKAPEDALRDRYARGELDRKKYERMLNDLYRPGRA